MRVLIIDDEPLARANLTNILSKRSNVEDFDCANDAVDALEKLSKSTYDILLLDINMPEVSGIELIDQLQRSGKPAPAIVFVTAHEDYAITAFEKRAVDYVLKPFNAERICQALEVAEKRSTAERAAKLVEALSLAHSISKRQSARIAIKCNGRVLFIDPNDVISVQAQGNYVLLQRESASYLLRESISVMEEKLEPHGFIRIHRSMLVNRSFVQEIQAYRTGEYPFALKAAKSIQ